MADGAEDAFGRPLDTGTGRILVAPGATAGVQGVKEVVVTDVELIRVDANDGAVLFMHPLNLVGKSVARPAKKFDVGLVPPGEGGQLRTGELCQGMECEAV